MLNNQVSFTADKKSNGVTQSALSSAANVAVTIGAGAAVGGGIGKLASLTPYKPKAGELNFQYADMFEKSFRQDGTPDIIKKAGGEVEKLYEKYISKAKLPFAKTTLAYEEAAYMYENLASDTKGILIKNQEVQDKLKTLLGKEPPKEGFSIEEALTGLKDKTIAAGSRLREALKAKDELRQEFIDKASKNEALTEIATKGAKHLRKRAIIGVGVGIGVAAALVLNILNTYGIIGKRKVANNGAQNSASMQPQATQPTQINTSQG